MRRLLDQLRAGDVVVVWKLDRLSRSLKDLLLILERIEKAGAGFRSLTEAIDTTVPAGRMMMQMLGAFAEFERDLISERIRSGIETARRKGIRLGRAQGNRIKLDRLEPKVLSMVAEGYSYRRIGRELAISPTTVYKLMKEQKQ